MFACDGIIFSEGHSRSLFMEMSNFSEAKLRLAKNREKKIIHLLQVKHTLFRFKRMFLIINRSIVYFGVTILNPPLVKNMFFRLEI